MRKLLLIVLFPLVVCGQTEMAGGNRGKTFQLFVAEGNIPQTYVMHKFGGANDVTTSMTVISTSKTYQTPKGLASLEVVSTSGEDSIGADGMRSIIIEGLIAGWVRGFDTVTMTGTAAAVVGTQFYRVYRVMGYQSGIYSTVLGGSNLGTITLQGTGGGAVWAVIGMEEGVGLGQTEIGSFSVPLDKICYIFNRHVDIEATKTVTAVFYVREEINDTIAPYRAIRILQSSNVAEEHSDIRRIIDVIEGPADIGFIARSLVGTADIEVTFEMVLKSKY